MHPVAVGITRTPTIQAELRWLSAWRGEGNTSVFRPSLKDCEQCARVERDPFIVSRCASTKSVLVVFAIWARRRAAVAKTPKSSPHTGPPKSRYSNRRPCLSFPFLRKACSESRGFE